MDREGHYRRAEQLAEQAAALIREGAEAEAGRIIALAQVHATLAASADAAAAAAAPGNSTAVTRPAANESVPSIGHVRRRRRSGGKQP